MRRHFSPVKSADLQRYTRMLIKSFRPEHRTSLHYAQNGLHRCRTCVVRNCLEYRLVLYLITQAAKWIYYLLGEGDIHFKRRKETTTQESQDVACRSKSINMKAKLIYFGWELDINEWGWVGCEELGRSRRLFSASVDNTVRDLPNSSYPTTAEFTNCFIIHWK